MKSTLVTTLPKEEIELYIREHSLSIELSAAEIRTQSIELRDAYKAGKLSSALLSGVAMYLLYDCSRNVGRDLDMETDFFLDAASELEYHLVSTPEKREWYLNQLDERFEKMRSSI